MILYQTTTLDWELEVDLEALALSDLDDFGHLDDHTGGFVQRVARQDLHARLGNEGLGIIDLGTLNKC